MKTIMKNWHKTIQASDPETFDRQIETILQDPAVTNHRLTYRGDGLCVCIEYQTTRTEYENVKEELEAAGEIYYCEQCPWLEPITDHRRHHATCKCGRPTTKGTACLHFYEALARGEIKPEVRR